jgi:DNA-binding NarL/FixJ family response regulator
MALKIGLQQLGYDVVGLASSGEDAISNAAQEKPDLMLMDIKLQGNMNGDQSSSGHQNPLQNSRRFPDRLFRCQH